MEDAQKAGAQISTRAFIQSTVILLVLMVAAGVLTLLIPAGSFERTLQDGREIIVPGSYAQVQAPDYPVWRWLTAPVEVLWAEGGITVIMIILFLLMVGASFAILDKSGILKSLIDRIVGALGHRKYVLLLVISLFFMLIGAFFGIFEEVVPLVPLMIALSYSLGWDSLVGLGMSILATNMGFSAAVTNPFTIGVAQNIAGLPLFSGSGLRIIIFLVFYALLAFFLVRYARRIEKDPESSPVYEEEKGIRQKILEEASFKDSAANIGRAVAWFGVFLVLILAVLLLGPVVPGISDIALPLVGLLFLAGGVGAGFLSGAGGKLVRSAALEGIGGIAPGIPLILMAASIKHIVVSGGIMDTLLYQSTRTFADASPITAAVIVFLLTLMVEFFISSGSAKAFLLIPILLPLAELIGVTRQVSVLAYCFGDGFSNVMYPTNPVLLISLGLTVVSYPKWIRWSLKLWAWVLLAALGFLALAVTIQYGPF